MIPAGTRQFLGGGKRETKVKLMGLLRRVLKQRQLLPQCQSFGSPTSLLSLSLISGPPKGPSYNLLLRSQSVHSCFGRQYALMNLKEHYLESVVQYWQLDYWRWNVRVLFQRRSIQKYPLE